MKQKPLSSGFEAINWQDFALPFVAGVDEVGRGCLAGPVYAAAVMLRPDFSLQGVTDSKLIKASTRAILAREIKEQALAWAIGIGSVEEIETHNILQASLLAMKRAIEGLSTPPQLVLIDGNQKIDCVRITQKTIIKGDLRCAPISCASIIAKVARDKFMEEQEKIYPGFFFADHKGYGTPRHKELIKKLGTTPLHRRSFCGVKEFVDL